MTSAQQPSLQTILEGPGLRSDVEALVDLLDARASDSAHASWRRQALAGVERWSKSPREPEDARALRCALETLERWDPQALRDAEVEALLPQLAPKLRYGRGPLAPLRFDYELRTSLDAYASPWAMRRFALPPALLTWLRLADNRTWFARDDDYALKVYGHGGVLECSRGAWEQFRWDRQRAPEEGPPSETRPSDEFDELFAEFDAMVPRVAEGGTGAWLCVGDWSDKHTMELCCDRDGPWGQVSDFHDGHPWLNGGGWGDVVAPSFGAYLAKLAGR